MLVEQGYDVHILQIKQQITQLSIESAKDERLFHTYAEGVPTGEPDDISLRPKEAALFVKKYSNINLILLALAP